MVCFRIRTDYIIQIGNWFVFQRVAIAILRGASAVHLRLELGPWRLTPPSLAVGFAAVILAGTLLLTLPVACSAGTSTPFIDALFTSTLPFALQVWLW